MKRESAKDTFSYNLPHFCTNYYGSKSLIFPCEYGYASAALVPTVIAPGNSGELGEQQSVQEIGNMYINL